MIFKHIYDGSMYEKWDKGFENFVAFFSISMRKNAHDARKEIPQKYAHDTWI
jgi:hypothetical protein